MGVQLDTAGYNRVQVDTAGFLGGVTENTPAHYCLRSKWCFVSPTPHAGAEGGVTKFKAESSFRTFLLFRPLQTTSDHWTPLQITSDHFRPPLQTT